jgi:nicotinamidase-related amidase
MTGAASKTGVAELWDRYVGEEDVKALEAAGYGKEGKLGVAPCVIIVDVTRSFTGDGPQPLMTAIAESSNSCGEAAWDAVPSVRCLADAARAAGAPVIYTHNPRVKTELTLGAWLNKNSRMRPGVDHEGESFVPELAPAEGDIVVEKLSPSAFFQTPVVKFLRMRSVDTVLVCGASTSGCVRATVVDAFSYGFTVGVVADACFDRSRVSHAVSLFDMEYKYADVMFAAAAVSYLEGLPSRDAG